MNTKYLALDLELNSDGNGNVTKIIQVGIAIGTPNDTNNIQTYKWYVDPKEPLTPFITQLTGITQEDIDTKAVSLAQVAKELGILIDQHKTFVNPVQWGMGDADELKAEFKENNVEFPYFGIRCIDVKTIFTFLEMAKGNNTKGGLRACMGKYKLKFKGEQHRADVDAYNTLVFYFDLMQRQKTLEELISNTKKLAVLLA